jgi:hypothetical protein
LPGLTFTLFESVRRANTYNKLVQVFQVVIFFFKIYKYMKKKKMISCYLKIVLLLYNFIIIFWDVLLITWLSPLNILNGPVHLSIWTKPFVTFVTISKYVLRELNKTMQTIFSLLGCWHCELIFSSTFERKKKGEVLL